MCGIFGVRRSWLERTVADPEAAVGRALDALRWRGRDGAGFVGVGDFVVGCARLAITDRRSRQPVHARAGEVGVLNGAITDARSRWAACMPRAVRRGRLPNDAWLPVLAARRDVEELTTLRGHHALAVVDAARDRLLLARDRFGEKPLFVARERGRVVAFASTVPALRALGVAFAVPEAARARFFAYGWLGSLAQVRGDEQVDDAFAGAIEIRGEREVAVAMRAPDASSAPPFAVALAEAVSRCADAEVEVALALSGGLDSSCLAVELGALRRGARGYQFCADGEPGDERAIAREVAQHTGITLREVDGGPEVLDALPRLTAFCGLPLGDPSVLAVHALAAAAAADGVRVLLSGEGADETLFGYARHRALATVPRWRLPLPDLAPWSTTRQRRIARALAARDPYASLLQVSPPGFLRAVLRAKAPPLGAEGPVRGDVEARLARAERMDRDLYLRSDLLPKLDVATMAAQVEGRCPFLDVEVQRAAAAIPRAERLGKAPLRSAFASRLPISVLAQRKRGFALPLDRWFRGELGLVDLLRDARTRGREHLDRKGLDRALDRHRRGAANLGHALYLVAAWETWLRSEEGSCA